MSENRQQCVEGLTRLLADTPLEERIEQMRICIRHFENVGCQFSFDEDINALSPRQFAEFIFIQHLDPMSVVQNAMMQNRFAVENAASSETPEEFVLHLLPSDGHLD